MASDGSLTPRGALAGRKEVLRSLCVTLQSDGRPTMAAAEPASQGTMTAERKRTR